jgi:lipid II:glycine glycyltransferase (peptidoglycan interpeptide bridge formation enzyme)
LLKINASDKEYAQYRPNYLLTWAAMQHAFKIGAFLRQ